MTAKKYEDLVSFDSNVKRKAFDAFYLELRGNFVARNWTRICKFLSRREDKEEIYQFSMSTFWLQISTNIRLENPKGYFIGLAKKNILNWCRKQANINQHLSDLEYESSTTFAKEEIDTFMAKDLVDSAINILAQENPRYAKYLLCYFINDLEYKEIQTLIYKETGKEISEGSIRNDIWRAKGKLKEIIQALNAKATT